MLLAMVLLSYLSSSYLNLDKARELKIRVCNAEHYGDHAVAEHTFALLFELIRRVGQLDKDVKAGNWAWASGDGLQLAGRRMGIIGLGGIGSTVAGIARALGMEVAAWNSHVPPEHFERSGATPVDDLNKLIETSDVISDHLPLNNATRGIVTAENLAHVHLQHFPRTDGSCPPVNSIRCGKKFQILYHV